MHICYHLSTLHVDPAFMAMRVTPIQHIFQYISASRPIQRISEYQRRHFHGLGTTACRYFAEAPAMCSGRCDNCRRQLKVKRQDMSVAAAAVVDTLQTLPAADKRLPLTQLVDAWRKSKVSMSIASWQLRAYLMGLVHPASHELGASRLAALS